MEVLTAYQATTPSRQSPRLIGRVVNTAGEPVADANITLVGHMFPRDSIARSYSGNPGLGAGTTTQSDAQGSFTLTAQSTQRHTLLVRAPGYVDSMEQINFDKRSHTPRPADQVSNETSHTVTLHKAAELSGIVKDDTGVPLSGAKIIANPATFTGLDSSYAGPIEITESDGEGKFTFTRVPEDSPLLLNVSAPSFAPAFPTATTGEPIEITLSQGVTVQGTAVDFKTSDPVGGVRLTLQYHNKNEYTPGIDYNHIERPFPKRWAATAITADSGVFSFRNVAPGPYQLQVSPNHREPASHAVWHNGNERMEVQVPESDTRPPLQVPLYTGYTVQGQVVETGTANPIAGAQVWLVYGPSPYPMTVTDSEGKFTFSNLTRRRTVSFQATADGYTIMDNNGMVRGTSETVTAHLPDNTTEASVTLEMARLDTISVEVVDAETQQPVSRARVSVITPPASSGRDEARETSPVSTEGRYEIQAYRQPGSRVQVSHADYATTVTDQLTETSATTFRIALKKGQTVSGTVADPDGKPMANARIIATYNLATDAEKEPHKRLTHRVGDITTDSSGAYKISRLPAEVNLKLHARAEGFASSDGISLDIQEGADITTANLQLRIAKRVAGRVVDENGQPIARTMVFAQSMNTFGGGATNTTEDGRFSFDELPDGPVRLQILNPRGGGTEFFSNIPAGKEDVELKLGTGSKTPQPIQTRSLNTSE